ncbi:hypothetical protein [Alicyclobacillus pomorum]|uniref:hypothetical protein n=1 Tax=Alicyclobacillus pomorum TaxID=204470 RepID=UPI00040E1850|nr:hypothetical protein [Alicyclobacillus pomorum]
MFKSKLTASIAAGTLAAGMFVTQAMAAQTTPSWKNIELNGQSLSKPAGIVHDGTTYMPIYYLQQVLTKLGIQNTWDGKTHSWNLTTPSYMEPNMSNIKSGTGDASIYLNHTLIQKVNSVAAVDPASGQATTYMPIWYLEQILQRLPVTPTWNGTVLNLKTNLNYVGNSSTAIVKYTESLLTNLSSTSDVNSLLSELYHEGYVTDNFVKAMQNDASSWQQFFQENGIQKIELTLFHAVPEDGKVTSTEIDLPTTEVDTYYYTNGAYYYQSQTNGWTLHPASNGVWQIDSVTNLDAQGSGDSTSGSGASTGSGDSTGGSSSATNGTNSGANQPSNK